MHMNTCILTAGPCLFIEMNVMNVIYSLSRCVRPVIPASMEATTATRTPAVTTWGTLPIPCTAASANRAMLATATSAERTQIWMDGPMLTWFVWRMLPTTAKRYGALKQQGSSYILVCLL